MTRVSCFLTAALLLLSLAFSCTQDAYEKGQGDHSLMRADLAEAHIGPDSLIDYFTTDDGDRLELVLPRRQSWLKAVDTVCRSVFYYTVSGDHRAEIISCSKVNVASVMPKDSLKEGMKTDPVKLESAWISKNRRYLNAGIYLKTGQTDDEEAIHRLAIVADTLVQNADRSRTLFLRLYHDQGGVPEYYSSRTYFSIPLSGLTVDSLCLTVQTYQGLYSKGFAIK